MKTLHFAVAFTILLSLPSSAQLHPCPPGLAAELIGGGAGDDWISSMVQLPDGGLLLGGGSSSPSHFPAGPPLPLKQSPNYGQSDFWILRLDASGQRLWDRSFGGPDGDGVASVQGTSDGGFVLGGDSYSNPGGSKTSSRYVQAITHAANRFRAEQRITEQMRREIIRRALRSDCGR